MKVSTLVLAGLLGCGIAGSAHAASWALNKQKSTLGFTASQSGTPFTGHFKTWDATIDFDPANPGAAHIAATMDVASATTDDAQKDEAMPQSDWFDVANFAKATFEATGFKPLGANRYETTGTLTLRGVGKNVTLPFELTITGDQAHAVGKAKIVRTDFGVGQGAWSSGDMVALDVSVDVDLVATRR